MMDPKAANKLKNMIADAALESQDWHSWGEPTPHMDNLIDTLMTTNAICILSELVNGESSYEDR